MPERTLSISQAGVDLIKEFEGCHRKIGGGKFTTYLCPAGIPTIGYGCTHGIKMGMVWTSQQCEDGLRRELDDIEAGVRRLVTVPLTQAQYDVLVSFTYNLGLGNLSKSTLLKKLNRYDFDGARNELLKWVYHNDPKNGGKVKSRGLIRRRHAEYAMWDDLPIVDDADDTQLEAVAMPQDVAPAPPDKKPAAIGAGGAAAGIGAALAVESIPAPPDLSSVMSWKQTSETVHSFGSYLIANPLIFAGVVGVCAALWYLPKWSRA